MQRAAVCIGVNYLGTDYALSGCSNDADDWASYLHGRGFQVSVVDEVQATKANIVAAMKGVVGSLGVGDVGVITFSGHGTWVPDLNGDEPDGKDEAICPVDLGDDGKNLLIDDEIAVILSAAVIGSRVVFITDSCHSGTVFRFMGPFDGVKRKIRYLPPAEFIKDPKLLDAVHKLGPKGPPPTDSPLPGVVHFGACSDNEYSYDTEFNGRANGAFTHTALQAAGELRAGATYADWNARIRYKLPSVTYPQTPRFNSVKTDRLLPVFT